MNLGDYYVPNEQQQQQFYSPNGNMQHHQQQHHQSKTTAAAAPFQPNNIFNNPMVSTFAVQYGTGLAEQGKERVSYL